MDLRANAYFFSQTYLTRKKQIDSANLQLEQSKSEYERSIKLFNDGLISEEAFQNIKTRYEVSQITRARAQNDFDLSQEKLSKTSILAPFDCTVLSRPVSIGQAVSGTGGQSSGTEVMEIADLNNLIILAHVNQADVSRMGKNQKVKIEIEAVADLVVDGIVERIAPQATIRSGIKGFSTRIKLMNTDPSIIPGMTPPSTFLSPIPRMSWQHHWLPSSRRETRPNNEPRPTLTSKKRKKNMSNRW